MKLRGLLLVVAWLAFPWLAQAHVGSPDVFYDGMVGPYPARVTIRMPIVVPGRAEISVRVQSPQPVEVSFLPLYSRTAVTNAPPPDIGQLIRGETNLYSGDLWLMTFGAYSIEVKVHGGAGDGVVEIPVNSAAIRQLPLPRYLGGLLVVLGAVLVFGGLAVVIGAVRDSALAPEATPQARDRVRGWIAGAVAAGIFAFLVWGGLRWWGAEEQDFQRHLRGSAWPDLDATVRVEGPQRILDLTLGKKMIGPNDPFSLIPDHGKLLHFFLIREGTGDAFGHLHPVRKSGRTFEVALPPLPAGRYDLLCDLTLEQSGMSFTATNSVELPPVPASDAQATVVPDPDDSWASYPADSVPPANTTNPIYHLPDGHTVVWKTHLPLRVRQDAGLQFEVLDAAGKPAALEPYMGMLSHAAVRRGDGSVFAHLHPSGNFSMAAQGFFQDKMSRETTGNGSSPDSMANMPGMEGMAGMDHSKMSHMMHHAIPAGTSVISLPYEFPAPGDYRIWVQFKTGGQVMTAVFDAIVAQ